MSGAAYGQASVTADTTDYNTMQTQIKAALAKVQTFSLVKVISCSNSGTAAPVGTVTVQVLANLMTGNGQSVPHGQIFQVPYLRSQGGANAIILDPVAGDIGLCGFCSRDISAIKNAKAAANPGSNRMFDWADAVYINGTLNGTPTQYLQFGAGGITVLSPTAITLNAPTTTVTGNLAVDGDSTLTGPVEAPAGVTTTTIAGASAVFTGTVTAAAFAGSGGGPGSGTVTSVGIASSTLSVSGGPIVNAGTLTVNLKTSGVTAGSYTSANITVNAEGIITAAANGSGGGGGSPGGSSGALQFNDSGSFGGMPSSWDGTNLSLQGAYEPTGMGGSVAMLGGGNGSGGQGGNVVVQSGNGDVSNGSVLISGAGGYTPNPGDVFILTDTALTLFTNGNLVASINGQTGTSGQALVSDGAGNVVWGSAGGGGSFSGVSVGQSTSQSIPYNTNTALTFDVSNYDTSGYHSTTTNNSRLTAPSTGYYLVTANTRPSSGSPPSIYYQLVKNGNVSAPVAQYGAPASSLADGGSPSIAWEGHLTAGDYVEFWISPVLAGVSMDNTSTVFTMSFRGT